MPPPINNNNNNIHQLYGGAITANIPSDMIDASTIRPIPSHQELYLSSSGHFISLLFEITERVCHADSDHEALLYHFEDIVEEEGHLSRVWETSGPIQLENFSTPPAPTYHLIATVTPPNPVNNNNNNNNNNHSQILSISGNDNEVTPPPTSTVILLSLIRLVPQSTDLLISINIPLHNQGSTTTTTTGTDGELIDFLQGRYGSLVQQEGIALRDEVVGSIRVRDWSLFDDRGESGAVNDERGV